MHKYNKGEWSELYAIIKIMNNNQISVNDINRDKFIKIVKIYLDSKIYDLSQNDEVTIMQNSSIRKVSSPLNEDVKTFLHNLHNATGSSFEIPIAESLLEKYQIKKVKTNSYTKSGLFTDSILPNEDILRQIGYSIKSRIGNSATLLNASQATNFIFRVYGFDGNMNDVNKITGSSKIMDRMRMVREAGGEFIYDRTQNLTFHNSLQKIDFMLPNILSDMLLTFYSTKGHSSLSELVELTSKKIDYVDKNHIELNLKQFVRNIALGMIPKKEWSGNSVNGGCIIVQEDGELVAFTLLSIEEFDEFLYSSNKFETASSTRHKFGELYMENGKYYFKLNLQIRFAR